MFSNNKNNNSEIPMKLKSIVLAGHHLYFILMLLKCTKEDHFGAFNLQNYGVNCTIWLVQCQHFKDEKMIIGRLPIVNYKHKAYQSLSILRRQEYYRDYETIKPSNTDEIEETRKQD